MSHTHIPFSKKGKARTIPSTHFFRLFRLYTAVLSAKRFSCACILLWRRAQSQLRTPIISSPWRVIGSSLALTLLVAWPIRGATTIGITSPNNGASFDAAPTLTLLAGVTNTGGSITKVEFYQGAIKLGQSPSLASPYSLLWPNVSAGGYVLTAVATDNLGTAVTSAPVNLTITALPANGVNLVPAESLWKYLDNGSDQGTAWQAVAFNDGSWASGRAQLGYGDGDEVTTVGFETDPNNKFITTYFRTAFTLTNASSFTNLTVSLLRDDGGVVYLNGTEIFRNNMPTPGPILFNTLASGNAQPADETITFYSGAVSPSLLLNGTNVVAVEIHQVLVTSSDISFDLQLIGQIGTPNTPPTVTITNPPTGSSFSAPASLAVGASASDSDGTVAQVDFYQNGSLIGSDAISPYSVAVNNLNPGSYAYRAVATDNRGASTTSSVVNVTVTGVANQPPTVSITSPANNSTYNAPTNLPVTVNANDPDGSVSKVEFFRSGAKVGESSGSPFNFTWTNVLVGTFQLTAVASDNLGAMGTSAPISITFTGAAPTTLIGFGSVWKYLDNGSDQGTAWSGTSFDDSSWASGPAPLGYGDVNGVIFPATVVSFGGDPNNKYITTYFRRTINVGNPAAYSALVFRYFRDDGLVVYVNGTEAFRNNIAPGAVSFNTFAALAGDDGSAEFTNTVPPSVLVPGNNVVAVEVHQTALTSSDIFFDLDLIGNTGAIVNNPPTVALNSPQNNSSFTEPANITFSASAADSDGSVSKVEFFANNNKVGQSTTGTPFTFTWGGVAAGNYALFAVATDNFGATATSAVVNVSVTVSSAPTIVGKTPAPGAVNNLSQVTVQFSQPVDRVDAADLLVNLVPATSVSTTNNIFYTFTFPQPMDGVVGLRFAANHGIVNRETPPKAFDETGTNATWQYTLSDSTSPSVIEITPGSGATLKSLTDVTVTFSEAVGGVDVTDLRMNGLGATSMSGSGAGPYVFQFAQPTSGNPIAITMSWTNNHGIHDFAATPNAFAGGSWSYTLQTNVVYDPVRINEIMYQPATENSAEEYVELYNTGAITLDLTGWKLKGTGFTFPSVTLAGGAYLVVAADLPAFHAKYPTVANVVGGWSKLSKSLTLESADGQKVDTVTYADGGDWGVRLRGAGQDHVISLTRNGSTATVKLFGNYQNGDTVVISGADQPEYNGTFTLGSASFSGFTYPVPGAPVSPATGVILCRQLTDYGHVGWEWSSLASGQGRSLELINPAMPNEYGQNWKPSNTLNGTPGRANSVASSNIAPLILDAAHAPLIPSSTNTVTVTARILDEHTTGIVATLNWRVDSTTPPPFTATAMFDDGAHGDGAAGDGVFGAFIAPQASNTVVEFYVSARDAEGNSRTWPAPALDETGAPTQAANALYQVGDVNAYTGPQPIYRIIMREVERAELQTFPDVAPLSNARMNATFINVDGTGADLRYTCGVRDRGAGTRSRQPANQQVTFPADNSWHGVGSIELNTQYTHSQMAGYAFAVRSGLNAESGRLVQVRINNVNRASSGSPQYGSYMQLESTNGDYDKNHFPDDPDGNLYKNTSGSHQATLSYIGTDRYAYANAGYGKQSNLAANDFSDLIHLTDVLNNTPDATYANAVRQVVNVDEWMLYFAAFTVTDSKETSLATGQGDDYSMYRGVNDPRFILLSHDWDTILGEGDTAGNITDSIFRMCPAISPGANTPVLNRFMLHPEFVPLYYKHLKELCDTTFSPAQLNPMLDDVLGYLVGVGQGGVLDQMKTFAAQRRAYILSQIPTNLTINPPALGTQNGFYHTTVSTVDLSGVGDAINTRAIKVNGQFVTWTAWQALWSASGLTLQPGINRIVVE